MADAPTPDPKEPDSKAQGSADEIGTDDSGAEAKATTETLETPKSDSGDATSAATDEASMEAEMAAAMEAEAGASATKDADNQNSTAEIEQRLDDAAESLEKAAGDGVSTEAQAKPFALGALTPNTSGADRQPIDLVGEVEMDLRIELGRTQMRLEEVLHLRGGSVVALDKLAGDPVDVFANGRLIARGEVLVMNDNFCIRVTELVGA